MYLHDLSESAVGVDEKLRRMYSRICRRAEHLKRYPRRSYFVMIMEEDVWSMWRSRLELGTRIRNVLIYRSNRIIFSHRFRLNVLLPPLGIALLLLVQRKISAIHRAL